MTNRSEIIGKILDILPEPIHIQVFIRNTTVILRASGQKLDAHVKDLINEALGEYDFGLEWVNAEYMIISLELQ